MVDGDTLDLEIDLGWGAVLRHHVRLAGVNTPEVRGPEKKAGKFVKEYVEDLLGYAEDEPLPEVIIHSKEFQTGKFGRCICDVYFGEYFESCLNNLLLHKRYGWATDANGSMAEPRVMSSLRVPSWVKDAPIAFLDSIADLLK